MIISYHPYSSLIKEVYNPKTFIPHTVSHGQAFAHCRLFLIAASRRSGARVSVPLWLTILSDQLPVIGLVGSYPTNYLIGRRLIPWRTVTSFTPPKAGTIDDYPTFR